MRPGTAAWRLVRPLDLRLTLGVLARSGRHDPCVRVSDSTAWRAAWTPDGPGVERIAVAGGGIEVAAWGPGAAWLLAGARDLCGEADDWSSFNPLHSAIRDARNRLPGLRLTRTGTVFESLVASVLEQKVPGLEARVAYGRLVRALGEPVPPAPGLPEGMLLPPAPAAIAATPYERFHDFGVERRRAETLRRAATYAARIEECAGMEPEAARIRLTALPGIGPWTAAEVTALSHGDPDAVSVGDYHLPHMVAYALAGEERGTDARMLELLEPYRGHRQRVLRLLVHGGYDAPRRGPRLALNSRLGFR